jgi:hypothetical protein
MYVFKTESARNEHWRFSVKPEFLPATSAFIGPDLNEQPQTAREMSRSFNFQFLLWRRRLSTPARIASASEALSAHSRQKFFVRLNGVALGLSSLIRDGRRTESPKTIASPMSRRGSISAIPAMLSGITDLTAD